MRWLQRVRLAPKLLAGGGLLVLGLVAALALLVAALNERLEAAEIERVGLAAHARISRALDALQRQRAAHALALAAAGDASAPLAQSRAELAAAASALAADALPIATRLGLAEPAGAVLEKLATLDRELPAQNARASGEAHAAVALDLIALLHGVVARSKLALDPELASLRLVEAIGVNLPRLGDDTTQLQTLGIAALARQRLPAAEQRRAARVVGALHNRAADVEAPVRDAIAADAGLRTALENAVAEAAVATNDFGELVQNKLAADALSDVTLEQFQRASRAALDAQGALAAAASSALAQRLEARAARLRGERAIILTSVIAVMLAALVVSALILREIAHRLASARDAAQSILDGRIDTPLPPAGSDEIGAVLHAFEAVRQRLARVVGAQVEMIDAHERGATDARIDTAGFPGAYARLATGLNELAEANQRTIDSLLGVMTAYARGDFAPDMPPLPGRKAAIASAASAIKANLSAVAAELDRLVSAAAAGEFAARGDATRFEARFRAMVAALNELMATTEAGVADAARVFDALAQGDLRVRMRSGQRGVFARLQQSADATAAQLSALVAALHDVAARVREVGGALASSTGALAARNAAQTAAVEQASDTLAQFLGATRASVAQAREVDALATRGAERAVSAGAEVRGVVATMERIQAASTRIDEIIAVIDGIAFQTNILALNAAVEAARAGAQGRGFAVVAAEVRALAQRSASAASEVRTLITRSGAEVRSGTAVVEQTARAIQEVASSIESLAALTGTIAAGARRQESSIATVEAAVATIDRGTRENAGLVEQAAALTERLDDQTAALVRAVEAFRVLPVRTAARAAA
jgi:methyl-accepting chemotaxis protein